MLAFKREAVALVVLAFYFLVLDQQTQESSQFFYRISNHNNFIQKYP